MASEVLSGGGVNSVSYTNNTSQNVRVIFNYVKVITSYYYVNSLSMNWTGNGGSASVSANYVNAIGKNIAAASVTNYTGQNMENNSNSGLASFPTELMLAPGNSFTISTNPYPYYYNNISAYNIVIIKEDGT